jgi:hypothetical protein
MFCNAVTLVAFAGDVRVDCVEGVAVDEVDGGRLAATLCEEILATGEVGEEGEEERLCGIEIGCIFKRTASGW